MRYLGPDVWRLGLGREYLVGCHGCCCCWSGGLIINCGGGVSFICSLSFEEVLNCVRSGKVLPISTQQLRITKKT